MPVDLNDSVVAGQELHDVARLLFGLGHNLLWRVEDVQVVLQGDVGLPQAVLAPARPALLPVQARRPLCHVSTPHLGCASWDGKNNLKQCFA